MSLSYRILTLTLLCCIPVGYLFAANAELQPKTKLKNGNITFYYSNQQGVGIAPRSKDAAESTQLCSSETEGAIRYNETIKNIEFCNGTQWKTLASKTPPDDMVAAINYPACIAAAKDISGNSLTTYYQAYGVPNAHNIHLACPKDYVFVGSDAQPAPLPSTYVDALCCPMHLYKP